MTTHHRADATIGESLCVAGAEPNLQILNLDGTLVVVRSPGRWVDRSMNEATMQSTEDASSQDQASLA